MHPFLKIGFGILMLFLTQTTAFTQTDFFIAASSRNLPTSREFIQNIKKFEVYQLDETRLRNYLATAPVEFQNNDRFLPLEIPLPNGTIETFSLVESSNLSPEIAAQHPEIKTYTGNGQEHPEYIVRMNLTVLGLSMIILNVQGTEVFFEHYSDVDPNLYCTYFASDAVAPPVEQSGRCGGALEHGIRESLPNISGGGRNNTGATLRTYRLAFAANAEFTTEFGGGTAAGGLAAVTNYVNVINAIYRTELSIHFTLVSGTNLIYTNAGGDPYSNDTETMIDENRTNVGTVIGSVNYDIAHVVGYDVDFGSGGGLAYNGVVCDVVDNYQAGGASVIGSGYAQVFYNQLILHEMGHQFGMNHSYNSVIPVCTTRNPATSVEPGAGATIMSYGFTCDTDDYFSSTTSGPILHFHTASYEEAINYINSSGGCFTGTSTGNTPPVVTMPGNYTIPISTPFSLTGSADSPESGDTYTFSWEGTNFGTMEPDATTLEDTSEPPFFRTYEPTSTPTRVFPLLSAILDGSNDARGDKLPSVGIPTTHRLTVRDNNAAGGGLSYGEITVTVDGAIGPFLETTNLAGSYAGNSMQTITWSVNGTNVATPNVNILLSTDGGNTFSTTLASNTPNDGSQQITLPNVETTTARIRVEAIGNIFFDISNADFTISSILPVELTEFNARLQGEDQALLTWETTSEVNNEGFEIEMSDNEDRTFRKIGFMASKGSIAEGSHYQYPVTDLKPGNYSFRLKMIDWDHSYDFSPVRSLNVPTSISTFRVYPNPSEDGVFSLQFDQHSNEGVNVMVVNALGQELSLPKFSNNNGTLQIITPGAGVYFLQVTRENGETIVQKLVVE